MSNLLLALDLAGTFIFAISGATAGVKHRLDLFGVLVLSFAAATAGGISRDVMIGATPPAAIADWRYFGVSMLAGIITFHWFAVVDRLRSPVLIFDAAGLSLFAVSGATTALSLQLGTGAALMLGVLTGIGGGIARDLLVAQVPVVLRSELYAVAALAAAVAVVAGDWLGLPSTGSALAGATLCFALRIMAIRRGWQLPRSRHTV